MTISDIKYCPGICLKGLRNTMKSLRMYGFRGMIEPGISKAQSSNVTNLTTTLFLSK
jgi:hypothetical protein